MTAGKVLMELLQNPKEPLGLSRHTGTVLADWLEEALLSSSPQKAGEIHDALMEVFQSSLAKSSDEVRSAVLSKTTSELAHRESFALGQLSLAQLVAAQALDRRASSDFNAFLEDKANLAYLKALCEEPRTNKALSTIVAQTEENVSRKLKRFRELGIVSSKKMGTAVINSLTAAAHHALEEMGMVGIFENERRIKSKVAVNDAFECRKQSASPYMQHRPGFSGKEGVFG
ncbi:winged helix-turn-helix domain-containing protein [Pseudomonas rhodesiae]|uniref:winged helix-turn-helix domain-containing protein n=1 Tax=Pseudomonas rhodesiae TaxID=76760 RepID=UPI0024DFF435|nr:winged helix-turn-helix domain-containing protein [Pseudomonas rhodesiae]WHT76062.1 hypothetical protein QMY54_00797 [Pseudomonas rhodesiae]